MIVLLFDTSIFSVLSTIPPDYKRVKSTAVHVIPGVDRGSARGYEQRLVQGGLMSACRNMRTFSQILIAKIVFRPFIPYWTKTTTSCESYMAGSETTAQYSASILYWLLFPFILHLLLNTFVYGTGPYTSVPLASTAEATSTEAEVAFKSHFFWFDEEETGEAKDEDHLFANDDRTEGPPQKGFFAYLKRLGTFEFCSFHSRVARNLKARSVDDLFAHDPAFWQRPALFWPYLMARARESLLTTMTTTTTTSKAKLRSQRQHLIVITRAFGIYLKIMYIKFILLVKMTLGVYTKVLLETMEINLRSKKFNIKSKPGGSNHERVISSVGGFHSIVWQFIPKCVFISKAGEAANGSLIFVSDDVTVKALEANSCFVPSSIPEKFTYDVTFDKRPFGFNLRKKYVNNDNIGTWTVTQVKDDTIPIMVNDIILAINGRLLTNLSTLNNSLMYELTEGTSLPLKITFQHNDTDSLLLTIPERALRGKKIEVTNPKGHKHYATVPPDTIPGQVVPLKLDTFGVPLENQSKAKIRFDRLIYTLDCTEDARGQNAKASEQVDSAFYWTLSVPPSRYRDDESRGVLVWFEDVNTVPGSGAPVPLISWFGKKPEACMVKSTRPANESFVNFLECGPIASSSGFAQLASEHEYCEPFENMRCYEHESRKNFTAGCLPSRREPMFIESPSCLVKIQCPDGAEPPNFRLCAMPVEGEPVCFSTSRSRRFMRWCCYVIQFSSKLMICFFGRNAAIQGFLLYFIASVILALDSTLEKKDNLAEKRVQRKMLWNLKAWLELLSPNALLRGLFCKQRLMKRKTLQQIYRLATDLEDAIHGSDSDATSELHALAEKAHAFMSALAKLHFNVTQPESYISDVLRRCDLRLSELRKASAEEMERKANAEFARHTKGIQEEHLVFINSALSVEKALEMLSHHQLPHGGAIDKDAVLNQLLDAVKKGEAPDKSSTVQEAVEKALKEALSKAAQVKAEEAGASIIRGKIQLASSVREYAADTVLEKTAKFNEHVNSTAAILELLFAPKICHQKKELEGVKVLAKSMIKGICTDKSIIAQSMQMLTGTVIHDKELTLTTEEKITALVSVPVGDVREYLNSRQEVVTRLNCAGYERNTTPLNDWCNLAMKLGLTEMNFQKCLAMPGSISSIADMVTLTHLDLTRTRVSGNIASVAMLINLKHLILSHTDVIGDIASVAKLIQLAVLDLFWCKDVWGDVAVVAELPHLTKLNLDYTGVSGDITGTTQLVLDRSASSASRSAEISDRDSHAGGSKGTDGLCTFELTFDKAPLGIGIVKRQTGKTTGTPSLFVVTKVRQDLADQIAVGDTVVAINGNLSAAELITLVQANAFPIRVTFQRQTKDMREPRK